MELNPKGAGQISCRPRLCVLTTTYPADESDPCPPFVYELCRRLAAKFEVTVIAPASVGALSGDWQGVRVIRYRYAPRRFQTLASGGGILPNVRRAPWQLLWLPGLLLGQAATLWRLRRRFDLIHAHWLIPQGLIALVFSGGLPVMATSHGADVLALRGPVWDAMRRWVLRHAAAVTAVGLPLQQALQGAGAAVHLLPMGADLQTRFTPDVATLPVQGRLLFVGRLVPKKGVDQLLQALVMLIGENPTLHLRLIGDGSEKEALQAQSASLGLSNHLKFAGALPNANLPQEYRQASVVVLPFRAAADGDAEGLGLTLIEALACGCTVVSGEMPAQRAALGALPGWYPVPSEPQALAAGIRRAMVSRGDPVQLRAQRENRLAGFDWTAVSRAYTELLLPLAEPHRKAAAK